MIVVNRNVKVSAVEMTAVAVLAKILVRVTVILKLVCANANRIALVGAAGMTAAVRFAPINVV